MKQNFEQTEDQEDLAEYRQFIKSSVENGRYFRDALDWYLFRYISPICDRTLLIFGAILAAIVLFFLVQMIKSTFPLVEQAPIIVRSPDQSIYTQNLFALKPKKNEAGYDPSITTIDDAVLKYLLSKYVQNREGYDFKKAEIEEVNKKFNRVRNVSSASEYKAFRLMMSRDNPNSPIYNFGKNIAKSVQIESVTLIKEEPQNLASRAMDYLSHKIPTDAEVRFTAITRTTSLEGVKEEKERYLAKVSFDFSGVNKEKKSGSLGFMVNGYKLFIIK